MWPQIGPIGLKIFFTDYTQAKKINGWDRPKCQGYFRHFLVQILCLSRKLPLLRQKFLGFPSLPRNV